MLEKTKSALKAILRECYLSKLTLELLHDKGEI